MKDRIYYTKPSISEREVELATDAARYGWGDRCYEYIDRFEKMFREYTGANYAVATSSCTGALHMGLAALDIASGDEVILADVNWIATVAPITYLGAKPVFVDILPDTWCIDPDKVEAAITPRTRAILAVHLYGNLCDMDALLEIGERYGIPVIEDAAEALGSNWHGRHAGTMGRFGTFSFHGSKTLTTGEGGMLVTNDADLYKRVQILNNHGRSAEESNMFRPVTIGYKYKISNIQAAIGCAQMERVDELVNRKREIFSYYKDKLGKYDCVSMNPERSGTRNSYWMPTVVFDRATGVSREKLLEAFSRENIDARVFFWPLSSLDMFDEVDSNTVSRDIPGRAINIPGYHDISREQQDKVIEVVTSVAGLK